jgi:hypothetical protein
MEKELCEKCNEPKDMYYKLWCPRCDKPQLETQEFFNFIRCVRHIEVIGNPGYKERVWNHIMDYVQGNDSMITLTNDESKDIKLLFDTFDIKQESMNFFVSW